MHVTEIWNGVACEDCFVGKEYEADKQWIFTTLSKESLARFLVWAKMKRTWNLYPLQMVRVQHFSYVSVRGQLIRISVNMTCVSLLGGEGDGSNKRQVVIHIFHSQLPVLSEMSLTSIILLLPETPLKGFTWRRRQNPVSEILSLNKNKTVF
jgi:hypothetical protein